MPGNAPHFRTPNFRSWTAIVLHRPHADADALLRQLERLGISGRQAWPELTPEDAGASVIFFDADMGYDGQFPWEPGAAPMPLIALLGSETPGRVEWAMRQGASAHLRKPLGSGGAFSALMIAVRTFAAQRALEGEVAELRSRLARRSAVARALVLLMTSEKIDEAAALQRLREIAMSARQSVEDAADALIASKTDRNDKDDSRSRA